MAETTPTAPAGWYPEGINGQRYWDGQAWTEHRAPAAPMQYVPPARNSLAIPALVLGIVGAVLSLLPVAGVVLGGIPSILAIIFGVQASKTSKRPLGRIWMATIGMLLGAAGIVLILAINHLVK